MRKFRCRRYCRSREEHGGQRIGNFANGRVIDVVDSGSIIDDAASRDPY